MCGGWNPELGSTTFCHIFNFAEQKWKRGPDMKIPRSNFIMIDQPNRGLVIIGGIDAVFYRTYQLLYHKFENMVIFQSGNLYSFCSPGNQENYLFVTFSSKKVEIGDQSSIIKNDDYITIH